MAKFPPLSREKHLEAGAKIETELRRLHPDVPFEMTFIKDDQAIPHPNLMGIGVQCDQIGLHAAHLLFSDELEKATEYFSQEIDRHGKAAVRT